MRTALASSKGWIVLCLATVGLGSLVLASRSGELGGTDPPPPASTEMAVTMMRVGLDAEALAAAGIDAQAVDASIGSAATKHDTAEVSLAEADAAYASWKPKHDALQRKIQSGLGSSEDVTAFGEASAQLAAATAQRAAVLDEIFASGIAGLSEPQQGTLKTIRANAAWKLPVQYLVVDRTEADWVKLRDFLDARRIYQESGEEVPSEVTSFLSSVESATAVSTAKASLDATIASVQTAWNAAVSE